MKPSKRLENKVVKRLINNLKYHPEDWVRESRYSIGNKVNSIMIWEGMGECYLFMPREVRFGFLNTIKLLLAVKRVKRNIQKNEKKEALLKYFKTLR